MHAISDALAERQANARRLSRGCAGVASVRLAPADPTTMSLRQAYEDAIDEPVPERLWEAIERLGQRAAADVAIARRDDAALA